MANLHKSDVIADFLITQATGRGFLPPDWFTKELKANKTLNDMWIKADDRTFRNCLLTPSLEEAGFVLAPALITEPLRANKLKELDSMYSIKPAVPAKDLILALCYEIHYLGNKDFNYNNLQNLVSIGNSSCRPKSKSILQPPSPSRPRQSSREDLKFNRDIELAKQHSLDDFATTNNKALLAAYEEATYQESLVTAEVEEENRRIALCKEEDQIIQALLATGTNKPTVPLSQEEIRAKRVECLTTKGSEQL